MKIQNVPVLSSEVFKRDSFTCQYCGATAPDVLLHVDHIEPVAKGGANDLLNLITSCEPCNAGKSDRRLNDTTAMSKKRSQLEQLQARKEQLELMMQWQKGLLELERSSEQEAADYWANLVSPYQLNEQGMHQVAKLLQKFPLTNVLEAMRIAARQYVMLRNGKPTHESVNKAWDYVGRICNVKKADSEKPYLKDLLYIRAIVRNRLNYSNERKALELLEDAYLKGVSVEDLKQLARRAQNWSSWEDDMHELLDDDT
jgi:hypothetical protein